MTTATEARRPGEFMVSEARGTRSREAISIEAAEGVLPAGTVLAKLTAGEYAKYTGLGTAGLETAVGILWATTDASGASDVAAAMVARDAEVNSSMLTGLDADATAELAALGIIVR